MIKILLIWCLAVGSVIALPAQASVVISGTRIIYEGDSQEVTLKLSNEGKYPALVQSWLDAGNASVAPSDTEVPFVVTPPIARIDPTKGQTLRIIYSGEPLPDNKESVFWLNVLEVPPKPTVSDVGENTLQMAFRSRVKLFFRPASLTSDAGSAAKTLRWSNLMVNGERASIQVYNPSSYHVSMILVEASNGKQVVRFDDGYMVAPGEVKTLELKGSLSTLKGTIISYTYLNDYGGAVVVHVDL